MDKTRNGCVTTEQAAAHPGSGPDTLERCRAKGGGPYVCCCNRVHDLSSGLDDRVEEHKCPAATGTDRKSPSAKINLSSYHSV